MAVERKNLMQLDIRQGIAQPNRTDETQQKITQHNHTSEIKPDSFEPLGCLFIFAVGGFFIFQGVYPFDRNVDVPDLVLGASIIILGAGIYTD